MNRIIDLNDGFRYIPSFTDEMIRDDFDESVMEEVRIPHTNIEVPYNYFDEKMYQFVSCYKRHIFIEEEYRGKRLLLQFDGVGHVCDIYIKGECIYTHQCGYTAFTVEITEYVTYGEDNIITIRLDSTESNVPPFGNVIDYLTYGGIYREVRLLIKEDVYIKDVFIRTEKVTSDMKVMLYDVEINRPGDNLRIESSLIEREDVVFDSEIIEESAVNIRKEISDIELWDINNPNLYTLSVKLYREEQLIDEKRVRFGFRECQFKGDGFYLNGRKIKIRGLNRHQSYPYVGYAMPKRAQRLDADILKNELKVNAVRTSHYPQSQHFIDRCDEIGLLVFTEIPGWQHIGDDDWKDIAVENTKDMVMQYRNHPSIILWGVRINESQDDDEFYKRTNKAAHELDSTRQTGGVRFLQKSNLLEDVYTYNDFSYTGNTYGVDRKEKVTPVKDSPYLISEFNGHMFPTKAFDCEEHRLEQARRYVKVLDRIYEAEGIAGGFGWCMFDYNTHKDFGSGDRICYHGVMDMYRNPKMAAAVYASQSDEGDVFEISSSMDIGEHPGGKIGDVYAFTNADSVKVYKNDEFVKEFYPAKDVYGSIPHPPVIINDFIGELMEKNEGFSHRVSEEIKEVLMAIVKYGQNNMPIKYMAKTASVMLKNKLNFDDGLKLFYKYVGDWGGNVTTYRFEAIRDGKVVNSIDKRPGTEQMLKVDADTIVLHEDSTYDVATVRIKACDELGNMLTYYQEPVVLSATGDIEIIGPKVISLKAGCAGTYVRTTRSAGTGTLTIDGGRLGKRQIKYTIE